MSEPPEAAIGLPEAQFHDGWPALQARIPGPGRTGRGTASRRRWPRWRWLALGGPALLVMAALVAAALAYDYQPLSYGSAGYSNEYFRGLPTGKGIHLVNTVGLIHADVYIPPQRGVFSLFVDIANEGSRPVVIEAVTVPRGAPVWAAGPARYAWQGHSQPMTKPHPLHHVRLGPGREVFVGLPVRTWSCASKYGWSSAAFVYVTYQFGPFRHRVALPWGPLDDELVLHIPNGSRSGPGPGSICATR